MLPLSFNVWFKPLIFKFLAVYSLSQQSAASKILFYRHISLEPLEWAWIGGFCRLNLHYHLMTQSMVKWKLLLAIKYQYLSFFFPKLSLSRIVLPSNLASMDVKSSTSEQFMNQSIAFDLDSGVLQFLALSFCKLGNQMTSTWFGTVSSMHRNWTCLWREHICGVCSRWSCGLHVLLHPSMWARCLWVLPEGWEILHLLRLLKFFRKRERQQETISVSPFSVTCVPCSDLERTS